jgi:hypothetical protein
MPDLPPLPASWNKANKVVGKFGVKEEEEENERKDNEQAEGEDSNKEGNKDNLHNIALAQLIIHDDLCAEVFTSADAERIVLGCHDEDDADQIDNDIGEPGNDTEEDRVCLGLIGAPKGWLAPTSPLTFLGYGPKHNAMAEETIDNPARWSMFTFTPVYSNNEYNFHSSPTGARVVTADKTGKQCIKGWEFHYQIWKAEKFNKETYVRTGASLGNLKPGSRKECFDVEVLRWHGLTPDQVCNDQMFFYQMLFPFCNLSEFGVESNHRMPYFSNICVHKHVRNVEGCRERIWSCLCTYVNPRVGTLDCCTST